MCGAQPLCYSCTTTVLQLNEYKGDARCQEGCCSSVGSASAHPMRKVAGSSPACYKPSYTQGACYKPPYTQGGARHDGLLRSLACEIPGKTFYTLPPTLKGSRMCKCKPKCKMSCLSEKVNTKKSFNRQPFHLHAP